MRKISFMIMVLLAVTMAAARATPETSHQERIAQTSLIQSIEYEILRNQTRLVELRAKLSELEQTRTTHTQSQKEASAGLLRLTRRPENMALVSGLDLVRGEHAIAELRNQTAEWLTRIAERNKVIAQLTHDVQEKQQALKAELKKRRDANRALGQLLSKKKPSRQKLPWDKRNQEIAQTTKNTSTLISEIIETQSSRTKRKSQSSTGGFLHPGVGRPQIDFGEKNLLGIRSLGTTFKMLSGARIIAPMSGQIVFAGRFRDHGQTVIIAGADYYHILLSGLMRLDVRTGDAVFAGEPIGLMPRQKSQRMLYLELRHQGRPINLQPLFVKHKGNP